MVKQAVETVIALVKFGSKAKLGNESARSQKGIVRPKPGDRANTVLIVGMEGTGKTELIKSCFGHPGAHSTMETKDFEIYTSARDIDGKTCWLHVADYMGQNVGMLVSAFIEAQLQRPSPLRYGHVNTLVLMVDLRCPEKDRRVDAPAAPSADPRRIKANLEQWSEMAVDAIFGLLTEPALSYVCLFVNKYDLISEPKRFSKARAQNSYSSLVEYLERKVVPVKAGGKIKVEVIVGSAKHGDGHSNLIASLLRYSVPAEKP